MKRGYIIECKRTGFISWVLGGLLKLFERQWSGWGWHLSIAYRRGYQGWHIMEATGNGVEVNFYLDKYLERNTRHYKWLDKEPTQEQMESFFKEYDDCRYDVAIYLWTSLQYLLLRAIEWFQKTFIPWHKFTISLPRILDWRYSCWELVFWFCRSMGKPIQESLGLSATRYPMISDFEKAMHLAQAKKNL